MKTFPVLLWFRRDLRLADQPALQAAVASGSPVVPVFIWSPEEESSWAPGAASRWWLHHSLAALDASLRAKGSRLVLRSGPSVAALEELCRQTGAGAVYWNHLYEPAAVSLDADVKKHLRASGLETKQFNSALLFDPWTLTSSAGKPYQVFTPFWRTCLNAPEPPVPVAAPRRWRHPSSWPRSEKLEGWTLLPRPSWADGFSQCWTPGEIGAHRMLERFFQSGLAVYPEGRNRPDRDGTSRLSPHLHYGEIGPRQVWHAVQRRAAQGRLRGGFSGAESYLREIGWREFAHHLLVHFPQTPERPLRKEFERMRWRNDPAGLARWQKGQTGFPIVDAGMRELWATGWMHNRVRMIVASFLVKDLRIDWREGAKWFWDTLVDADLANNTLGWQWAAGSGADAAPYYRIFNPTLQAERFDPDGTYVRRWVPELGTSRYPKPIVDHAAARAEALVAYAALKSSNGPEGRR